MASARQWAHELALTAARQAAAALGGELVPSEDLNWRQRQKTLGTVRIGRRVYHVVRRGEHGDPV